MFRAAVRGFLAGELIPNLCAWERDGGMPRSFWRMSGDAGMLCPQIAEADGGPGLNYSYNAVVAEEFGYLGLPPGLLVHSDIVAGYISELGTKDQRSRWLPSMVSGAAIGAIAMTEPGAGSDLKAIRTRAIREGDNYKITGSKIYITNGVCADLVIVAAVTDLGAGSRGVSLFVVERDTPGFQRGPALAKIGQHSSDTSELYFDEVIVPVEHRLGAEGAGFGLMMKHLPQERLAIAIMAQATAQRAFDEGVAFCRERRAFGKAILDHQNTRFTLATLKAELAVGWAHIDSCLQRHVAGSLDPVSASAAKLWHTELQGRCCDVVLQLHGGAGYMADSAIGRLWRDSRVTRIFGGTSEIMREIIGRSL